MTRRPHRRRRTADELPVCICGCDHDRHQHWRAGTDCGHCGRVVCPRYRPDLNAVCRDDQVVDAIRCGDITRARQLTDDVLVDALAALAALRGAP